MISPQAIDLKTLPSLPLSERRQLPQVTCIYFAIDSQNRIQYIGKSVNLKLRWSGHHQSDRLARMEDVRIAWLEFSEPALLPEIELALIDWFLPPLNRLIPPRGMSQIYASLRERSGKTQRQVADALGVTITTVQNWEAGRRELKLNPRDMLTLCSVLDCSLEELANWR